MVGHFKMSGREEKSRSGVIKAGDIAASVLVSVICLTNDFHWPRQSAAMPFLSRLLPSLQADVSPTPAFTFQNKSSAANFEKKREKVRSFTRRTGGGNSFDFCSRFVPITVYAFD